MENKFYSWFYEIGSRGNIFPSMKTTQSFSFFNGNPLVQTDIQKHLGMFLDTELSFLDHLETVFWGLLRKL